MKKVLSVCFILSCFAITSTHANPYFCPHIACTNQRKAVAGWVVAGDATCKDYLKVQPGFYNFMAVTLSKKGEIACHYCHESHCGRFGLVLKRADKKRFQIDTLSRAWHAQGKGWVCTPDNPRLSNAHFCSFKKA